MNDWDGEKEITGGDAAGEGVVLTSSVLRRGSYASLTGMEPKRLLKLP